MAKDVNAQLTLLEVARRTDPKGNAAKIAEILDNTNEIWQDVPWLEANGTTFHRVVRRTSLPGGSWRQLNAGVATESSTTETVDEGIGLLESYSEADKWIIDNSPNPAQARMDEAKSFIEGMGQTLVKTLFERAVAVNYGDAGINPERFNGFPARLKTLQAATVNKRQVVGEGGTGADTCSIYGIQWAPDKIFMAYPKGSRTSGIEHQDLGEVTVSSATSSRANTAQYQAYRDWFRMNAGLVVRDNRAYFRLANIESDRTGSNIFDEDNLIELLNNMPNAGGGTVLYCNRYIKTQMEIRLKDKSNVNFTVDNGLAGVPVMSFRGSPVRLLDQLTITETAIS